MRLLHALDVPDIDSNIGLMHTLFALEDLRGLIIGEIDGELYLRLDKSRGMSYVGMEQAKKLEAGEITREEYDQWRYRYPEFHTAQKWVKPPSQKLSDSLIKELDK